MKYDCILIRFSELTLKSNPVRQIFQKILVRNIKNALHEEKIENKIISKRFHLILKTNQMQRAIFVLRRIFGIISVSPAISIGLSDMKSFFEKNSGNLVRKDTFAVRVSRDGNHEFSSKDVEREIGSIIVERTRKKVNLTVPDLTVYIDIRNDEVYVYFEKIHCAGGLPLGTAGRVICYVEKKDDVVAAWLMMKRGCIPILCYKKFGGILDKWSYGIKLEKIKIGEEKDLTKIGEKFNVNVFVFGNRLNSLEDIENKTKKFKNVFFPVVGFTEDDIDKYYTEINIKNH